MHFAPLVTLLLAALVSGFATTASNDPFFDNGSTSLSNVACSNGANGLLTKGYTTFNSLPAFPYIGGAPSIHAWNSTFCGTCWSLTYTPPNGQPSNTINVLGIDSSGAGFNIAQEAMNALTNNQAVKLGLVNVDAEQVDPSKCKMPSS